MRTIIAIIAIIFGETQVIIISIASTLNLVIVNHHVHHVHLESNLQLMLHIHLCAGRYFKVRCLKLQTNPILCHWKKRAYMRFI